MKALIKALWFDLDNTLINRDEAFIRYLNACWPAPEDVHTHWLALDDHGQGARGPLCEAMAANNALYDAKGVWSHIKANLGHHVVPNQVLLNVMASIKARFKICLISNGSGPNQRRKLRKAGLDRIFDEAHILISGEVGHDKPDRVIFERAQRITQCSLEETIMIGDNVACDCIGAMAYGVQCAWVSWGRVWPQPSHPGPQWTHQTIDDLIDWLNDLIE